ncbi:MAG: helix-turn-helix domain-containing protein [Burkholderiales bacterium]|nr:helix-turn-helix domain-containing protein [Burkholderiales bacterium]MDE2397184.1 helix-turn-helix domain-containing protein [Burkholderiales bacterium]MDE2456663.1 helix-turn-helix domain-containing protein [Burkholderiales bacterium]
MADKAQAIEKRDLIEGLGRGLRVIEAFDDEHPRLTPSQVGALTGITRTAARRYLLSLVHFGYAGSDGRQFWLLPRVLRLGQSYLGAARLPRLVQPFIQRVSMESGETVNVSVLDGHEVVYIARSNSPRLVSIGYHLGARVPAHVVTPGLVMLAAMEEPARETWIAEHNFSAFTPHTVTDASVFRASVEEAQALGYGMTTQQLDIGLRGVAVALRDRKGACKGALGMTLPATAFTTEQIRDRLLPLLNEAVQALRPLL